jgi:hypothetical protein
MCAAFVSATMILLAMSGIRTRGIVVENAETKHVVKELLNPRKRLRSMSSTPKIS